MNAKRGIFWLSSYPKSGNTWFRIVLANLLNPSKEPIDLNQLYTGAIASARTWMDDVLGFDSAELTHDEIDCLRPEIYAQGAIGKQPVQYHKIHDAYTFLENDTPLIPREGCLGALYFIRNPLDVAISFANHSRCSIDSAIENMGNKTFAFCKSNNRQHHQLRQHLLSWSMHVQSWIGAKEIPMMVLRYEDMKQNPLPTFAKAFAFLNITALPEDIARAVDHGDIKKLQQQEEQVGFRERPSKVARFFRKGIVGDWQNTLTASQVERIIADHGEVMHQHGYIDTQQNPII